MKCPRCEGLMVSDQIYDIDGPFLHIDTWKCLNCGGTVDPTILRVQKEQKGKKIKDGQSAFKAPIWINGMKKGAKVATTLKGE